MRTREITVVAGLLAAFAAAAVLFTDRAGGGPSAPPPVEPVAAAPVEREEVAAPAAAAAAQPDASPAFAADARDAVERSGPPPTSGAIEGRVSISTEVLGRASFFHVRVVELVNQLASAEDRVPFDRVTQKAFPIPADHTPRFRIEDVPFSRFGYRVELIAPDCNGSSAIVRITEDAPLADVTLSLTKPVVFTVRVRDQYTTPHAGWRLELRPVGDPPRRGVAVGETDNFGTALFEELVQGEYSVWHDGRELGSIDVQPITVVRSGHPISVQSATLVVPTGHPLRVEVFGPAGIGLEGASLELYKTDTTENRRYTSSTGFGGVHTFEHLEEGRYQIDVWAEGYQRTSRTVRVPEDALGALQFRLVPLR